MFNKIVYEPLPELSGDSSLISIVQRACQKDRDNRFQSCQEWLNEMNGKNSSFSPSKHNDAPKLDNTKEEKRKLSLYYFALSLKTGERRHQGKSPPIAN